MGRHGTHASGVPAAISRNGFPRADLLPSKTTAGGRPHGRREPAAGMNRSIRVAALQLSAHQRDAFTPSLVDGIVAAVEEASAGAELVVLPEGTLPSYVLGHSRIDDGAVRDALDRLSNLARGTRTAIVVGAAVRSGSGLRNAAVAIDRDGSPAGRADKLFLWHFDRLWFEPGDRLEPVETAAGKLGILVCADGRLPTIARTLVDRGAEMLVMPTAWVTSGRDPHALENVQADLLARVRAFENGVPFVAANKCGAELGMVAYCGKSQIVDAFGNVLVLAGERAPETLKAVVETGAAQPYRTTVAHPTPRATPATSPVRIAISVEPLLAGIDEKLAWLGNAHALAPGERDRFIGLDRTLPVAQVEDAEVLDPGGLVAYRRAGYRAIAWTTQRDRLWTQRLARARALELRLYAIVFDLHEKRAFAVDPDGVVVAGTYDDFTLASFSLDPRKTVETTVAPGTDVADGLERIASVVIRGEDKVRA